MCVCVWGFCLFLLKKRGEFFAANILEKILVFLNYTVHTYFRSSLTALIKCLIRSICLHTWIFKQLVTITRKRRTGRSIFSNYHL